jgi:hypothetical protein
MICYGKSVTRRIVRQANNIDHKIGRQVEGQSVMTHASHDGLGLMNCGGGVHKLCGVNYFNQSIFSSHNDAEQ